MEFGELTLGLAFLAGLASFLSPCVFSLVPAYIGYLGGRSAAAARDGKSNRWLTLSHGLAFVGGFSVVFILLGVATSALGGLLFDLSNWLAKIGGVVVIIFGLHMTGILRIPFLEYDLRPQSTPDRKRGYLASGMMGVFFSAGWSPCVGPILGAILTLALSGGSITQGALLLTAYSAGLAIPFLVASIQIGLVTTVIRRYGRLMHYVEVAMGAVLIVVGVLLFIGRFEQLAALGGFFTAIDEVMVGWILLVVFLSLSILALIPAWLAARKGRNFFDWWFFGVGLFPVALIMALRLEPKAPAQPERRAYIDDEGEEEFAIE
ncbi:MAG TPA: cytochrome c biogenesis protein CcdA, partial [Anaerolineales bacterium]|nr:cytochrome c biogenesis protein CcdA [Anaerolineales bacterium]